MLGTSMDSPQLTNEQKNQIKSHVPKSVYQTYLRQSYLSAPNPWEKAPDYCRFLYARNHRIVDHNIQSLFISKVTWRPLWALNP